MKKLEVGSIYKHYKGTKVRVLCVAKDSENLNDLVIYMHLEDGAIWARPLKMFLENIKIGKKIVERFKKIKLEVKVKPNKKK